jgi:BirA family biotin operon repressor/biotin-[acetyl-CoA-carboxylase] ligase
MAHMTEHFSIGETSEEILKKLGHDVWFRETTTSTNQIAKDEALSVSTPLKVYLANHQSAGRGRGENTWSDQGVGSALLSSWSFSFKQNPQPILAPLVGLAVFNNLDRHFSNLKFSLKAPNDILLGEKKLCGILIENILSQKASRSIIGIGLNVFACPPDLGAAHLSAVTEVNRLKWEHFLKDLSTSLREALQKAEQENLSPDTCSELKAALNRNSLLKSPVLEVSPKGSLIYKNSKTDWHQL